MELKYIFTKKKIGCPQTTEARRIFYNLFSKIFINVTFDTFEFILDGTSYNFSYKCNNSSDDILYLVLSMTSKEKPLRKAKVLSKIDETLKNGQHRKDFYITTSYNGASEYYCEKLAPRFGKFERLMRLFIYTSITNSLGIDWFEKSFTKEMQDQLKERSNRGNQITREGLIERGLEEMTFQNLYDFLFAEYPIVSPEVVVYDDLLTKDLNSMTKKSIIEVIYKCKKQSLWNRFFENKSNLSLEKYLADMREYRNKVAHNKSVNTKDYVCCTQNLKIINKKLLDAIDKMENTIYSEQNALDTILSFGALLAGLLKSNYDIVATVQENFADLGNVLIKAIQPIASVSEMKKMYDYGSVISYINYIRKTLDLHNSKSITSTTSEK